jgi:anti-anti-sigma factor
MGVWGLGSREHPYSQAPTLPGKDSHMTRIVHDPKLKVKLSGEIDYSNAEEVKEAVDQALQECPAGFVIDLSEVTYLDSAGIQVILYAYKRIYNAGGDLTIMVANRQVKMLLDLIHLEKFPGVIVLYNLSSAA